MFSQLSQFDKRITELEKAFIDIPQEEFPVATTVVIINLEQEIGENLDQICEALVKTTLVSNLKGLK